MSENNKQESTLEKAFKLATAFLYTAAAGNAQEGYQAAEYLCVRKKAFDYEMNRQAW